MLETYLKSKTLNVRDFCNELDDKYILILFFLNRQDREALDMMSKVMINADNFFRTAKKAIGNKNLKQFCKEVVDILIEDLEEEKVGEWSYSELYSASLNNEYIHFNSKTLMLQNFINLIMSDKLDKIDKLLSSTKLSGLKEQIPKFLFPSKPIINSLCIITLIGKSENVFEEVNAPFVEAFFEELYLNLFNQFDMIKQNKMEFLNTKLIQKELEVQKIKEDNKKKESAVIKQKELNKNLKTEYKILLTDFNKLKSSNNQNKNDKDNENYKQKYETVNAQLEEKQKGLESVTKTLDNYKGEMNSYKEEVRLLNLEKNEKEKIINSYLRKLESYESKTIETYLDDYLEKEGFTDRLVNYIEPLLNQYKLEKEKVELEEKRLEEQEALERNRVEQKIGYVTIEDNKHIVNFIDGTSELIKEIPISSYIARNQFIKVQFDGTFKWLYNYHFEESERDNQIYKFGSVVYKNGEPHLMVTHLDIQKIEKIPPNITLRENQIISVNKNMELIRFYKATVLNADYFMDSIKAKEHQAFYVLQVFPNGVLLRNIETGEEQFGVVESEESIEAQQVIVLQENQLIRKYSSPKFYTLSSYYKQSEHGVVEIKNDIVFIKKLSGELVIVNELPYQLDIQDGNVIIVDEFNNFLKLKRDFEKIEHTEERKKLTSAFKTTTFKKGLSEKIEIKKEVLIIGKITYEFSYKMAFLKQGYRAEIVDGYEPWAKVKSAIKGKDFIVVVTEFVSHDSMWQIREVETKNPIIFSEHDGANRILEQVLASETTGKLM